MAKETKFIEVGPNEVNSALEIWQGFGWEMIGTPQEINYTTTHRTQETDKHYSSEYTTQTNYVKITFQRDKAIPKYAELVDLERKYNSITPFNPGYPPEKFSWLIAIILGIFYIIPGVIYVYVKKKSYTKKYEEWEKGKERFASDWKAKEDIARRAQRLIA